MGKHEMRWNGIEFYPEVQTEFCVAICCLWMSRHATTSFTERCTESYEGYRYHNEVSHLVTVSVGILEVEGENSLTTNKHSDWKRQFVDKWLRVGWAFQLMAIQSANDWVIGRRGTPCFVQTIHPIIAMTDIQILIRRGTCDENNRNWFRINSQFVI